MPTATKCRPVCILALIWLAIIFARPAIAEDLVISGSGNPEYVISQLASAFNARQSAHRVAVPPSTGMAGGIRDVLEGRTSLARAGRPLTEAELAQGLVYVVLGREAIVVAGGAGVTARGITLEQLFEVYSGKITNWNALGGKPAPIRAIGKESTDSVRRQVAKYFKDLVLGDLVKVVHLDTHLIELLDRYPSSFTIMNRSALGACKTKVVYLALNGIEPSIENLANGSYPLVMEFGLLHKPNGLSPAAKAFLDFVRSPDGAKILRAHGVLVKGSGN